MALLNSIKKLILPLIPIWLINQKQLYKIKKFQSHYTKVLERLKNKEIIKVAFFLIHSSVWKYDRLFQLMLKDERFDPIVVICPYISFGDQVMIKDLKQSEEFIRSKKYPYVVTLNYETGEWLNVKKIIKPDVVFFTNPHKLTKSEYYIFNYTESLNCYVQYSFHVSYLNKMQYDQLFHNFLFRAYYETSIHLKMAKLFSRNKAKNVQITGYPGVDYFLDSNYIPKNPWKVNDKNLKKIIWSPHHSINENEIISYSCFLKYDNLMLEFANKYKNYIQIAFKPHPLLRDKLFLLWGKEKTEYYYNQWETGENTLLEESDYIDLFLTSDALINDSGSFITEYLFTNKRSAFTYKNKNVINEFNEFGKLAINCCHAIYTKIELESFILDTIRDIYDPLKETRESFVNDYLSELNNKFASENILISLKKILI